MSEDAIHIIYHEGLASLEELMQGISRPGDFQIHGRAEIPLPRVEIDGFGLLSFPVPPEQAARIAELADRAPYGRGGETITDTSVRRVWQLPPEKVRITGKSWDSCFAGIMEEVRHGLGFPHLLVEAELYKFLLYDQGGFFKAHRDTEKAPGMIGTLVVVLPSLHEGGQIVVRHAGREESIDLAITEVSEISYAAFFADCEHEVLPVTAGNRICLVYNLILRDAEGSRLQNLTAPDYRKESHEVASLLTGAFSAAESPPKIAWLLEHQYSPAGLSFAGLKQADAGRVAVLCEAARLAGCVTHLGMVSIEEFGTAEINYAGHYHRHRYWNDEEQDEDDEVDADYEVVEVSDGWQRIDYWVNTSDQVLDLGEIPIGSGELLPNGALDGEAPDQQRVTEATGNEGASFERSYRRAVLVIWREDRWGEVLLQSGIKAAIPHLATLSRSKTDSDRQQALTLAGSVIDRCVASRWELRENGFTGPVLDSVLRIGDFPLIERTFKELVLPHYMGPENEALVHLPASVGLETAAQWFQLLLEKQTEHRPAELLALLGLLHARADFGTSAAALSSSYVERLTEIPPQNAGFLSALLDLLLAMGQRDVTDRAVATVIDRTNKFDPVDAVALALPIMTRDPREIPGYSTLWQHSASMVLARSEVPPFEPDHWTQKFKLSCKCADCGELFTFGNDPLERVHRFRMAQQRRSHLEDTIRNNKLDMDMQTERKGSPHVLICTKNRGAFLRACQRHERDLVAIKELLAHRPTDGVAGLAERLSAASMRQPLSQH